MTDKADKFELPNVAALRLRCILRLQSGQYSNDAWTPKEIQKITELMDEEIRENDYASYLENEGLRIIRRDLLDYPFPIPKWPALVSWLAPEGACSHVPMLLITIAMLALRRDERANFPLQERSA